MRSERGGNEGKRQNSRSDDTSEHAGFFWGKARLRGSPCPIQVGLLRKVYQLKMLRDPALRPLAEANYLNVLITKVKF